jgi:hypothetical protein
MASLSIYEANVIINKLLRNQTYTPPTTLYLALFTAVTGLVSNNPSAEVSTSGTAYSRQTIALNAASGGATANTSNITFTTATASWGTVTHWALVDHQTNTNWGTNVNVLLWGAVNISKPANLRDTVALADGELDITVT